MEGGGAILDEILERGERKKIKLNGKYNLLEKGDVIIAGAT